MRPPRLRSKAQAGAASRSHRQLPEKRAGGGGAAVWQQHRMGKLKCSTKQRWLLLMSAALLCTVSWLGAFMVADMSPREWASRLVWASWPVACGTGSGDRGGYAEPSEVVLHALQDKSARRTCSRGVIFVAVGGAKYVRDATAQMLRLRNLLEYSQPRRGVSGDALGDVCIALFTDRELVARVLEDAAGAALKDVADFRNDIRHVYSFNGSFQEPMINVSGISRAYQLMVRLPEV
mmetsp:Transcript_4150/g.14863  ORF Transcript_4150/g.14863 Transcript_4150/m.14863 type:complete len:235 (+) Transcript_4150:96-800(+)|eukprot:scaffold1449_cov324-Prasinococcus_capsulatus_cf.AAC.10